MLMDYDADVLHGWPDGQALQTVETITAAATLANGDWVEMQSDGTVNKVSTTKTSIAGLVVRGNSDASDAKNVNKAVILWSNYIVRIKSTKYKAAAYAAGSKITVGGSGNDGKLDLDAGSDPIVGTVMKVIAATATDDASLVILVK